MKDEEIKPLLDWLLTGFPVQPLPPPPPSRGTLLRRAQQTADRESGEYAFDPANVGGSEYKRRRRSRELWLLELEADAADMEAAGNNGWPPHFRPPVGMKTAVVQGILSAEGWTPLKEKLQRIWELKEELKRWTI